MQFKRARNRRNRVYSRFLTTLVAISPLVLTTACGNFVNVDIIGFTGVSHDGAGGIIVHVNLCNHETQEIAVSYIGTAEPSIVYTIEEPQSGYVSFPLDNPYPWTSDQSFTPSAAPNELFEVEAIPTKRGGPNPFIAYRVITGATISYAELVKREPDDVLIDIYLPEVNRQQTITLDQFKKIDTCDW